LSFSFLLSLKSVTFSAADRPQPPDFWAQGQRVYPAAPFLVTATQTAANMLGGKARTGVLLCFSHFARSETLKVYRSEVFDVKGKVQEKNIFL
jgi:hypothetical protein